MASCHELSYLTFRYSLNILSIFLKMGLWSMRSLSDGLTRVSVLTCNPLVLSVSGHSEWPLEVGMEFSASLGKESKAV